jgi:hypothetical protein
MVPANLTAKAVSQSQIDLSWASSTDNIGVVGYKVERSNDGVSFTQIAIVSGTSYSDTGLSPCATYYYRVRAYDGVNSSNYSNVAGDVTLDTTVPTAPKNLTAFVFSSSQIDLSWTASTDNAEVVGYEVERSGDGTNFAQIATGSNPSYSDTGLSSSTTYYYRVRAYDAANNNSNYSNVASSTTQSLADAISPSAPVTLIAKAVSQSQIDLSWTASTDNVGVAGYNVERSNDGVSFTQITTRSNNSCSDTGLDPLAVYYYRVNAHDAAGNNSLYSAVASATTQFPSATVRYEETDVNISWFDGWIIYTTPMSPFSNGGIRFTGKVGANATFTFAGREVSFISSKIHNRGIARIYIDGIPVTNGDTALPGDTESNRSGVDLYSNSYDFQHSAYVSPLLDYGLHTITIEITGLKNPSASNSYVDVDAFDVVL